MSVEQAPEPVDNQVDSVEQLEEDGVVLHVERGMEKAFRVPLCVVVKIEFDSDASGVSQSQIVIWLNCERSSYGF